MTKYIGTRTPEVGWWYKVNGVEYYIVKSDTDGLNFVRMNCRTYPNCCMENSRISYHDFRNVYRTHPGITENFK